MMTALSRVLNTYRPNEQDYMTELFSLRREIEFLEDFIDESSSHRSLAPAIEDLRERETAIKKALQESELPPVPDELRNPFTRPRTPDEKEYIRQLIRKHRTCVKITFPNLCEIVMLPPVRYNHGSDHCKEVSHAAI